jgi:hypothetical protein
MPVRAFEPLDDGGMRRVCMFHWRISSGGGYYACGRATNKTFRSRQLSAATLAPLPFVDCIAHGLVGAVLEPCHERAIELEAGAALRLEKPAHILHISIRGGDRGLARNLTAMPVESCHCILRQAA